jgi:DNA-binding transcriptional ArsR family regulator
MPAPAPDLERFAAAFAALGHGARLAILGAVLRAHPEGLVVSEIQERVAMPGSTLSHHLDALRQAGILVSVREGQRIRYRVRVEGLRAVRDYLEGACCADGRRSARAEAAAPPPRPRGGRAAR